MRPRTGGTPARSERIDACTSSTGSRNWAREATSRVSIPASRATLRINSPIGSAITAATATGRSQITAASLWLDRTSVVGVTSR